MKTYTDEITEEIIISNGIEKIQTIVEGKVEPRMIIKYNNGKEMIINGDNDIKIFIDKLKQK